MAKSVVDQKARTEIENDVVSLFDKYVRIPSTSSIDSKTVPSTPEQWNMLNEVARDLEQRGARVEIDRTNAFVYATVSASRPGTPFGVGAHVDSSPDQPGAGIEPQYHRNYQGGEICFPKAPGLVLSPADTPELTKFIGDTIITSAGDTLLSADDKAGVAAIVAAVGMWQRYPNLPRPEVTAFITRDEEVGRGVDGIDIKKLPRFCYTIDGSMPGELEYECFDAIGVTITFKGKGVHPGLAYGKMVNAALAASHFGALLNRDSTPERTRGREGFTHLSEVTGNNETASMRLLLRSFEHEENLKMLDELRRIGNAVKAAFPGLEITIEEKQQYPNMRDYIAKAPEVVEAARRAISASGLEVLERPIRGGTDGSRLSALGVLTPNIFAGGLNFHSRTECVAVESLVGATETILNLGAEWTKGEV